MVQGKRVRARPHAVEGAVGIVGFGIIRHGRWTQLVVSESTVLIEDIVGACRCLYGWRERYKSSGSW